MSKKSEERVKTKPPAKTTAKAKKVPKGSPTIYQIKITLARVDPPVWRRIQVPDCPLGELHHHIQRVMGWDGCHLFQFMVHDTFYADLAEGGDDFDSEDAYKTKISDLIPPGKDKFRFTYEYDFGDGWMHQIDVEKVLGAEEGITYPRCTEGANACPPEDVGGPYGYMEFVEAMKDPKNPRHEEFADWFEGSFDPAEFDLKKTAQLLRG